MLKPWSRGELNNDDDDDDDMRRGNSRDISTPVLKCHARKAYLLWGGKFSCCVYGTVWRSASRPGNFTYKKIAIDICWISDYMTQTAGLAVMANKQSINLPCQESNSGQLVSSWPLYWLRSSKGLKLFRTFVCHPEYRTKNQRLTGVWNATQGPW